MIGQVVSFEANALRSVGIALFDTPSSYSSEVILKKQNIVSIVLAMDEFFKNGWWTVVGFADPIISVSDAPYDKYRKSGFIGTTIYDAGLVCKFVDAYRGKTRWDSMHDPSFFNHFLNGFAPKPPF